MPTSTKTDPKKTANKAKQKAEEIKKKADEAKQKLNDNQVAKTAADLFAQIKDKTGASSKKVDEWQKTWLAMPETRKKYKNLIDVPEIVGEELLGITNDVIQFIQRQEGGDSIIFKKIKGEFSEMTHHPLQYFQKKFQKSKEAAMTAKSKAQEGMDKAKAVANQAKARTNETPKIVKKTKTTAKKTKK